jgi:hypothetical protein
MVSGARLAEGSYLVVRIPGALQAVWDWNDYVFNVSSGQIGRHDAPTAMIPYNYLVFSVSRYQDDSA